MTAPPDILGLDEDGGKGGRVLQGRRSRVLGE